MKPREISERMRERAYTQLERLHFLRSSPKLPARGFKSWLQREPLGRFYPGVLDAEPGFIAECFPKWMERTLEQGESACCHEFQLPGGNRTTLGTEIDWHKDPFSGVRWEFKFGADYKPAADAASRDVRVIFELNRHQHLPRLAAAYTLTGDERYATEAVSQMDSWIGQNSAGYGINWHASLEIAIRALSWMWTIFAILGSRAFTDGAANKIGRSLLAQIQHVYRHLPARTQPNIDLIGEAAVLFIAGTLFEEHKAARAWASRGAAILNEAAKKQVLDGAVHGELSSWYHCYAVDFYLQAVVLDRRNNAGNRMLAPETETSLLGMLDFLMHLARPDGTIPLLGDDDGGRAFPLANGAYRSSREALAIGAVLFRRPDFKRQSIEFPQEAFWLLGRGGLDQYHDLPEVSPQRPNLIHPTAGYAIQRTGWESDASHVIFDCGGLGMLKGERAHADSLAIQLFSGGRDILTDSGTYVFACQPEWRAYFRSTAAHNTVSVDDRNQAISGNAFTWESPVSARGSSKTLRSHLHSFPYLEGRHDGYTRREVTHRRGLIRMPGDYWLVLDKLSGSGTHSFAWVYHFGLQVEPVLAPHVVEIQSNASSFVMAVYATEPLSAGLHRGATDPIFGWASSVYGEVHPISALHASMSQDITNNSAGAISLLSTCAERPHIERVGLDAGRGVACTLERDGITDLAVFLPDGGEAQIGELRMEGEFFWVRSLDGVVQDSVSLRATRFEFRGLDLLEPAVYVRSVAS
jgi:hypothetical protein